MTQGPAEPSEESKRRKLASEASQIFEAPRQTPLQILARGTLVVVLLLLIFGVLIPQFADYSEVWNAITSLSATGLVLMVALTLTIELMKSAAPSLLIEKLGLGQAFLAQESAAVVSNTIPGPSGTIAKYATYRRYGIEFVDFSRGTVLNGVWSNIVPLVLPSIAMLLLATEETIPDRVVVLTLVALVISLAAIVVCGLVVRSERFARRFGELMGRLVNWMRGLVSRPPSDTVGEAVVRFRFDVLATARQRGVRLTLVILGKEVSTVLALLVAVRSLGVGRVDLTVIEVFAAYTLVRLLTLIEITPGNVGIAEALYISFLSWASPGTSEDVIVAAVFVFRMFTYLGPILLGGCCWLWLRRYFRRHPTHARQVVEE
jgi:putative heme transporter